MIDSELLGGYFAQSIDKSNIAERMLNLQKIKKVWTQEQWEVLDLMLQAHVELHLAAVRMLREIEGGTLYGPRDGKPGTTH